MARKERVLTPTTTVTFRTREGEVMEVQVLGRLVGPAAENAAKRWAFREGIGPVAILSMRRDDVYAETHCPCCLRPLDESEAPQ